MSAIVSIRSGRRAARICIIGRLGVQDGRAAIAMWPVEGFCFLGGRTLPGSQNREPRSISKTALADAAIQFLARRGRQLGKELLQFRPCVNQPDHQEHQNLEHGDIVQQQQWTIWSRLQNRKTLRRREANGIWNIWFGLKQLEPKWLIAYNMESTAESPDIAETRSRRCMEHLVLVQTARKAQST